jgi:ADP-heptose:LPS heptosyltransferase
MGYNQKPENAVQLDLPCRPCSIFGNKPCQRGDWACLNNISPDLIIKKVETIILTKKTKTL